MSFSARWIAVAALALLAACGQRGALHFPGEGPEPVPVPEPVREEESKEQSEEQSE